MGKSLGRSPYLGLKFGLSVRILQIRKKFGLGLGLNLGLKLELSVNDWALRQSISPNFTNWAKVWALRLALQ